MDVIVVNGAPGVGKSTVLRAMADLVPPGSAMFDGDDVARVRPHRLSLEWLNLVQENLLACAENFRNFGVNHLFIAFPFPSQERVDRLNRAFGERGFGMRWVSLLADAQYQRERLVVRNPRLYHNLETLAGYNEQVKALAGVPRIDTTAKTLDQVAAEVVALVFGNTPAVAV